MIDAKTNLRFRLIPVVLIEDFQVVKSRAFQSKRIFGSIEQTMSVFNIRNVDEIIILDISASRKRKSVDLNLVKLVSRCATMPLIYGGGISSVNEIAACLEAGCDKVSLNTACFQNKRLIKEASDLFGSQCLVANVDIVKKDKKYRIYSHIIEDVLDLDIVSFFRELQENGVGEICVNSVDQDGMMAGYDIEMIHALSLEKIAVPVILSGGCGSSSDIQKLSGMNIQGAAMGSIFYYTEYSYSDIKRELKNNKLIYELRS